MQRISLRHPLAATLALLSLLVATMLPLGSVASAATATATSCPPYGEGNNCFLAISAAESVPAGQPFTISVALMVYGLEAPNRPIAPNDVCSFAVVSLDVYDDGEYFASYSAGALGGIATFRISVPPGSPGTYHYYSTHAYVSVETSPCGFDDGYANFTALTLEAGQPIARCPDGTSCVQVTNNGAGGGSAATLFANAGTFSDVLFEALDPGYEATCRIAPADPVDPVLSFSYQGTFSKTIVFALSPDLVTKDIERYYVCWNSTTPFRPRGDGPLVTTGILPACDEDEEDADSPGPCVLYKRSTKDHGALIGVRAPPSDPKGYPGSG